MRHNKRWLGTGVILAVLTLAAFAALSLSQDSPRAAETATEGEPATVEQIAGTELSRVTLSARAAERLGIQTVPVRDQPVDGAPRKLIPYGAVLYDAHGGTWTYTNPEPLVFIRHAIGIDRIEGDQAVLLDGPPAGTDVVAVGAALLSGTETGVGH